MIMTRLVDLRGTAKLLTMAASAAAARMIASMLLPLFPRAKPMSWFAITKQLLHDEVDYLWHDVSLTESAGRWPKFALVGATYDAVLRASF